MPTKFNLAVVEKRFWKHVYKTEHCWFWIGATQSTGYGTFGVRGKIEQSHRLSWIIRYGAIPKGQFVLHKCDCRNCVNPDHLFLGVHQDNAVDRNKKGRGPQNEAENNGRAKLTWDQVKEIRVLHRCSNFTQAEMAEMFGVKQVAISRAIRGATWKNQSS